MAYKMTARRRAALRKAQAASARKRRGKGKGKLAKANRRATRNRNIAMATGGLAGAAALAGYSFGKISGEVKAANAMMNGSDRNFGRYHGAGAMTRRDLVGNKIAVRKSQKIFKNSIRKTIKGL